jgi:hypothetical protein
VARSNRLEGVAPWIQQWRNPCSYQPRQNPNKNQEPPCRKGQGIAGAQLHCQKAEIPLGAPIAQKEIVVEDK